MSRGPTDPGRRASRARTRGSEDDWPEPPDPWAEADRRWNDKWTEDADVEELPAGYEPTEATLDTVTDSYEAGMREAGPHLGFGLQIGVSMVAFTAAGWALDNWLGTTPWLMLVGAALGFAGVMVLVLRMAREANRR